LSGVGVGGGGGGARPSPVGRAAAGAGAAPENPPPPRYQVTALTAVLVKNDGTVLHVFQRDRWPQIRDDMRALISASPASFVPASGKPATPAASSSAAA